MFRYPVRKLSVELTSEAHESPLMCVVSMNHISGSVLPMFMLAGVSCKIRDLDVLLQTKLCCFIPEFEKYIHLLTHNYGS